MPKRSKRPTPHAANFSEAPPLLGRRLNHAGHCHHVDLTRAAATQQGRGAWPEARGDRNDAAADRDPATQTTSGGDFMVDVFKTLDIDYLAMNSRRASAVCTNSFSTTAATPSPKS